LRLAVRAPKIPATITQVRKKALISNPAGQAVRPAATFDDALIKRRRPGRRRLIRAVHAFLPRARGRRLAQAGFDIKAFFLTCVIVAGIFGALTASRKILWIQAAPRLRRSACWL